MEDDDMQGWAHQQELEHQQWCAENETLTEIGE